MMTFEEYCEDVLDLHIGMMSDDERNQVYVGYKNMMAPEAKAAAAKHPDAKLKLAELRAKVDRLAASQKITIERNADKDLSLVKTFVEQAEAALSGKAKKADLLELITLNSEASRSLNNQINK